MPIPVWRCISRRPGSDCCLSDTTWGAGSHRRPNKQNPVWATAALRALVRWTEVAPLAERRPAATLVAGVRPGPAKRADHCLPGYRCDGIADDQLDLPG